MTTMTAPAAHESDIINLPRAEIIDFARKMAEEGSVTVTSPVHPDLVEHRVVAHDTDADGYTLVFITVVNGVPEVTSMDFDFGDIAPRHLVHPDGFGVTLCDVYHRPLVTYRIR